MKAVFFVMGGVAALVRHVQPADLTANGDTSCYVGSGKDYRGMQTSSKSGRQCQRWTQTKPHAGAAATSGDGLGNHNYCRNPDGSMGSPWCYTEDPELEKEECEIPECTAEGAFARDFPSEADVVQAEIGSTDCECADQLYGSTTTTADTSVGKAQFLQKKGCPCKKK